MTSEVLLAPFLADVLGYPIGLPWGVPPAVIFFVGAALMLFPKVVPAPAILVATPLIGLLNLLYLNSSTYYDITLLSYDLSLLRVDELSFLFGLLFHIAALLAGLFALRLKDRVQHASALVYAGSALGAVFTGDLVSLFVYWELLALSSAVLIWARGSERAAATALRYLLIHVGSGLLLLAGAALHIHHTGSATFGPLSLETAAGWLILMAFGIKCGFPLLHSWLPDAYPEASPTGTVFLSAFTTKVAVYALARSFAGAEILIYVGTVMTAFPIFYAVIENDLRRVLAYSMINQLGFMVVGIGLGTAMAMNGAVSHAFNDVIFKALLFMSMGAVLHVTGRINGSDLGGLHRKMPITASLCIVGAASISAFPLFSGFVSKSMVMTAALDEGYVVVWLVLLFASAGVFHHAGIKIPYFAFFAHDARLSAREPPWNMLLAMALAAALCLFNGAYPWLLYGLLPYPVAYEPYTWSHVVAQLQLLFFSALAFVWLMRSGIYPPELRSVNLDFDWLYRRGGPRLMRPAGKLIDWGERTARAAGRQCLTALLGFVTRHHGPRGILARTWPTGSTVLWVSILLVVYLIYFFV